VTTETTRHWQAERRYDAIDEFVTWPCRGRGFEPEPAAPIAAQEEGVIRFQRIAKMIDRQETAPRRGVRRWEIAGK
jgi:hypothetical protein